MTARNDDIGDPVPHLIPSRVIGGSAVVATQIYIVPERRPARPGPWTFEADRLAWVDGNTGMHCVILRAERGGHLCGYVGVEIGHPLFGWDHRDIPPGLGVHVHGGIGYSDLSDEDGPEAVAVRQLRIGDVDDPRWWFGFSCDQPSDLLPGAAAGGDDYRGAQPVGAVYRGEDYLLGQCTALAFRLMAVATALEALLAEPPTPRR